MDTGSTNSSPATAAGDDRIGVFSQTGFLEAIYGNPASMTAGCDTFGSLCSEPRLNPESSCCNMNASEQWDSTMNMMHDCEIAVILN